MTMVTVATRIYWKGIVLTAFASIVSLDYHAKEVLKIDALFHLLLNYLALLRMPLERKQSM